MKHLNEAPDQVELADLIKSCGDIPEVQHMARRLCFALDASEATLATERTKVERLQYEAIRLRVLLGDCLPWIEKHAVLGFCRGLVSSIRAALADTASEKKG